TIGMKNGPADCPVIGDNVDIGSNAVLLGAIRIGDNAVIGAGAVVLRDVPPGDVVGGNPARSIKQRT
ncbi:MAG: DapH/DapD/GlmU-related protein, partial [Terrimicrobiaceae bacterium]